MTTMVALQNQHTGEIKRVKVGWNWIIFLFSGFFGLPLFLNGLQKQGFAMLTLSIINILTPDETLKSFILLGSVGIAIYLGIKGNELIAKHLLESGWDWVEPEHENTTYAKSKWAVL